MSSCDAWFAQRGSTVFVETGMSNVRRGGLSRIGGQYSRFRCVCTLMFVLSYSWTTFFFLEQWFSTCKRSRSHSWNEGKYGVFLWWRFLLHNTVGTSSPCDPDMCVFIFNVDGAENFSVKFLLYCKLKLLSKANCWELLIVKVIHTIP
jgi:hypothetical protein